MWEIIGCQVQRDFSGLSPSYTNPRPDFLHFSHPEFLLVPLLPHAPHILTHLGSLVLPPELAYPLHSNAWFILTQPSDFIPIVISLKRILLDFPNSMCSCHSTKFIPNITCLSPERAQGAHHLHLHAKLPGSKSWHHYILVVCLITSYLTWCASVQCPNPLVEIKAVFA